MRRAEKLVPTQGDLFYIQKELEVSMSMVSLHSRIINQGYFLFLEFLEFQVSLTSVFAYNTTSIKCNLK